MTNMDVVNLIIAIIGVLLGLFGTVLSLITTWREFDRDKVKLRVSTSYFVGTGGAQGIHGIAIDVVNLSAFPVTIREVGFLLHNSKQRLVIVTPTTTDGGPYPRILQPRSSVSLLASRDDFSEDQINAFQFVYAKTSCGVTKQSSAANLAG